VNPRWLVLACVMVLATSAAAEDQPTCHVLRAPRFKIEPTLTVSSLFAAAKAVGDRAASRRQPKETVFEMILSVDLPTRVSWLEFTVEMIFLPFDRASAPELDRSVVNYDRPTNGIRV
jgi:hypothetical protein